MEKCEIILKNDLSELNRMAAFIEEVAVKWNLNDELLFQLNLVTEEVVSNIIQYGYDSSLKNENIALVMSVRKGDLKIKVTDQGIAFNPLLVPPPDDLDKPASERHIGGLGIYFIRQVMDQVEYHRVNDSNVLILTKKLSK